MNYFTIYTNLIEKAKQRCFLVEGERHHIVPRCLGGDDSSNNLVLLTFREHFVAHLLLAKIHGGNLWFASNRMLSDKKHTNKQYEWIKKRAREENRRFHLGKKHTHETKEKMSASSNPTNTGRFKTGNSIGKGVKKTRTEQWKSCTTRFKKGDAPWNHGKSLEKEHKSNLRESHIGQNLDSRWVHRNNQKIRIKKQELEKYIAMGFSIGMK